MLDIGWPELLVVAVILIVVVGPKDLPPMLRAFGKMTTRLRKTAGEFRSQFDEALREADMDDVRQTISDARKLNPMNSVRDALNPLKDAGNEIKSGLQKAVSTEPAKTEARKDIASDVKVSEPAMKLPDTPPVVGTDKPADKKPAAAKASAKPKKTAVTKAPAQKATTTTKASPEKQPAPKSAAKSSVKSAAPVKKAAVSKAAKAETAKAPPKARAKKKTGDA